MQRISPFLWFNDNAEEAAELYTSLFENSRITNLSRYAENTPGPAGSVMSVSFVLAGQEFSALNGGPVFSFTPAISFFVNCDSEEEVGRLWTILSEGGSVLMELGEYPFSKRFGWISDRFGVSWQLNLSPRPQKILPCLMFTGDRHGRAEEAMSTYMSQFEQSTLHHVDRYGTDDPGQAGTVRHAVFALAGQSFMAMDSGLDHQFTFTPAISFFVNCQTQEEVNALWEGLSKGGEKGQCGWLTDRYGVSWQIVPTILGRLMGDSNREKADRVVQAMLKMTRLNIAELQDAFDGTAGE